MREAIRAVIFDYGGVVCRVDDEMVIEDIVSALGVSLAEFRRVAPPLLAQLEKGLVPEKQFWCLLSEALDKPVPPEWPILFTRKWLEYVIFYDQVFDLARKIKEAGLKTAVLSNSVSPITRVIGERKGYVGFDVVVVSHEVHLSKPDPRVYQLTAKKLGLPCQSCLYLDDKEKHLIPAGKLGMKTLLVTSPDQAVRETIHLLKLS